MSGLLASLCAALARHYASRAYTSWLSPQASDSPLAQGASRANHLWATLMIVFALLTAVLVVTGLWRGRKSNPG